jgi:hypothetical protein
MVDFYSPDDKPYGKSYEEHIIDYWKEVLAIPAPKNPMEDKTGATYALNPAASMACLYGNTGGTHDRAIKQTIPSEKGLFISINPVVATTAEAPGQSIDNLAKDDAGSTSKTTLRINDETFSLPDLEKYRFHTREFDAEFGNPGLAGAKAGATKAVADGYYVITKPLPPGEYTVITEAEVDKPFDQKDAWTSRVTYRFKVQ